MPLPDTSLSLLSRLRDEDDHTGWQVSWKRFYDLYNGPLMAIAAGIYRQHELGEKRPEFRRIVEKVEEQILKEIIK